MSNLFKRTKILATIGPSVRTPEKIEEIILAGVNGCRLNFSHGTYEEHEEEIKWIRDASARKNRAVAIVQDLQGPKIRLGELKDNHLEVRAGDDLILDSEISEHDGSLNLPVQYNLAEKAKEGDPLFLFDGKVKTKVVEKVSKSAIKVRVENNGVLMSKKGINLPETDFLGDVLTDKDLADIEFGAKNDYFDYVAMSFVQSAEDIENLRRILRQKGSSAKIIAKIETKKAIESDESLMKIIEAADGVMVARGDMAVEAGNEVVPIVQRKIISFCREHAKFCIVATQMFSSMVDEPEPTRAEVSDVAAAVLQGADAVMLSDETTNGKYPIEAVKEMKKVILYTQNHSYVAPCQSPVSEFRGYDALSEAAARLAEKIDADVLVCQTASGNTSLSMAAQRPHLPILSVTSNSRTAAQLALIYGSVAFVRPYSPVYGLNLVRELKNSGYLHVRDNRNDLLVVLVSGEKDQAAGTDTIHVCRI